jgi:hypothetical protein
MTFKIVKKLYKKVNIRCTYYLPRSTMQVCRYLNQRKKLDQSHNSPGELKNKIKIKKA